MRLLFVLTFVASGSALAAKAPTVQIGDLDNGSALVKAHCGACNVQTMYDPMVLAKVGEPALLEALRRGKGVGPLVGWDGSRLHELEAWDVVRYLRQHSISLTDLLPHATHFSIEEVVPNEWGRERLHKQARVFKTEPTEDQVKGSVIVVWQTASNKALQNVTGDTSIMGGFERNEKLAYVLLRTIEVKKKKVHIGLALDRETLKVQAARAVYADGSKASSALRAVRQGCRGKGRRDNYRRFSCGRTGGLARPIWNAFIVGAEQIYAQEIAERENDFGDDLGDDSDSESGE
jgi:hypothetical protein